MSKLAPFTMYGDPADTVVGYHTWCPGCRSIHPVYVTTHVGDKQVHHCAWSFNGDLERPTFSPSLLVYGHKREDGSVINPRCHSFITDGRWHFCGDCEHALAGQVVDMEEWADEMWDRRADV